MSTQSSEREGHSRNSITHLSSRKNLILIRTQSSVLITDRTNTLSPAWCLQRGDNHSWGRTISLLIARWQFNFLTTSFGKKKWLRLIDYSLPNVIQMPTRIIHRSVWANKTDKGWVWNWNIAFSIVMVKKKKPHRIYAVGCLGLSECHTLHIMTKLIMGGKQRDPVCSLWDARWQKHWAVSAKLTG